MSSVYSHASPELGYDNNHLSATGHAFRDVSPPSSPEPEEDHRSDPTQPRRFRSMRDVSPVDEGRGAPRGASNIPVLRKAPPSLRGSQTTSTQKFWGGKVAPNSKVRWDEYSGEPTAKSSGKTSQVSPGSYVPKASDRRTMGQQVSVNGAPDAMKKAGAFSERPNRSTAKPTPVDIIPKPREPWKGASGRVEIVQPFKDRRSTQPMNMQQKPIPRKSGGSNNTDMSNLGADTTRHVPVKADTGSVAADREGLEEFDTHENPIKPTVPLKVGRSSPPRSLASPVSPHNPINQALHSYPSPITPTHKQPLSPTTNERGTSKRAVSQPHSTPPNTKVVRKSIESTPGSTAAKDHGSASRFSWTTHNTSTTYQQSPPPSPPPPLPTQEPVSVAASILNRHRQVSSSDKATARKPINSARTSTMTTDPPSPRPASTFSTNTQKALPRPPTEISAADHVDILEAQLDDLRLRRSNVNRLLRDLNNRAPPNPLITDFKRMRIVEQRKKDFEEELAEIRKVEHDVGLKLHRAWRKRERNDPNGSESAIWVRRVTR